jgi:hypothetical protein
MMPRNGIERPETNMRYFRGNVEYGEPYRRAAAAVAHGRVRKFRGHLGKNSAVRRSEAQEWVAAGPGNVPGIGGVDGRLAAM